MLRKKITAWVLTAAMLTGLGAAAPVTAFAQTAEDVQQNRCYINGDEVRAYDVEDTIYVVVDDLSAYGFNVQKSKKSVTITSGTNVSLLHSDCTGDFYGCKTDFSNSVSAASALHRSCNCIFDL